MIVKKLVKVAVGVYIRHRAVRGARRLKAAIHETEMREKKGR